MTGRGPLFIAYVYGGWHRSPWRDNYLEWDLYHNFKPYHPQHPEPFRPLHGMYDDSRPELARQQIEVARAHGITAFTYFLYSDRQGFVMDEPVRHAFAQAPSVSADFRVALTWCLRLPHHELPIRAAFKEYRTTGALERNYFSKTSRLTAGEVLAIFGEPRVQNELPMSELLRLEGTTDAARAR